MYATNCWNPTYGFDDVHEGVELVWFNPGIKLWRPATGYITDRVQVQLLGHWLKC